MLQEQPEAANTKR